MENEDPQRIVVEKLVQDSWKIFKDTNYVLLLFPVLSFTVNLMFFYIMGISLELNLYLLILIVYFLCNFVIVYFNCATVNYVKLKLFKEEPSVLRAFVESNKIIGKIITWALYKTTVGIILSIIRSNKIGEIFAIASDIIWQVVTYFVIPIMVFEQKNVWESIKESKNIVKKHWTDALRGEFYFLKILLTILLFFIVAVVGAAITEHRTLAKYLGFTGIGILLITIVTTSSVYVIYNTILYRCITGRLKLEVN